MCAEIAKWRDRCDRVTIWSKPSSYAHLQWTPTCDISIWSTRYRIHDGFFFQLIIDITPLATLLCRKYILPANKFPYGRDRRRALSVLTVLISTRVLSCSINIDFITMFRNVSVELMRNVTAFKNFNYFVFLRPLFLMRERSLRCNFWSYNISKIETKTYKRI